MRIVAVPVNERVKEEEKQTALFSINQITNFQLITTVQQMNLHSSNFFPFDSKITVKSKVSSLDIIEETLIETNDKRLSSRALGFDIRDAITKADTEQRPV